MKFELPLEFYLELNIKVLERVEQGLTSSTLFISESLAKEVTGVRKIKDGDISDLDIHGYILKVKIHQHMKRKTYFIR